MDDKSPQDIGEKLKAVLGIVPEEEHLSQIKDSVFMFLASKQIREPDTGLRTSDKVQFLQRLTKSIDKTVRLAEKAQKELGLDFEELVLLSYALSLGSRKPKGRKKVDGPDLLHEVPRYFNTLFEDLKHVSKSAFRVAYLLETHSKKGRMPDTDGSILISDLSNIFHAMPGIVARRSWNDYEGEDDGVFLRFADTVLRHYEIELDSALSYLVRKTTSS